MLDIIQGMSTSASTSHGVLKNVQSFVTNKNEESNNTVSVSIQQDGQSDMAGANEDTVEMIGGGGDKFIS